MTGNATDDDDGADDDEAAAPADVAADGSAAGAPMLWRRRYGDANPFVGVPTGTRRNSLDIGVQNRRQQVNLGVSVAPLQLNGGMASTAEDLVRPVLRAKVVGVWVAGLERLETRLKVPGWAAGAKVRRRAPRERRTLTCPLSSQTLVYCSRYTCSLPGTAVDMRT